MPQHDMNIANQGFPAFRADLNNALGALVSNNSGATAPATTFAHQYWVDTSANPSILKIRNADNDAFITIGTINQTADTFTLTAAVSATTLNTSGQVVFNDAGANVDFRVEGDTDANLLFVDASADNVGIGTSTPANKLHIFGGSLRVSGSSGNNAQTLFTAINFSNNTTSTDPGARIVAQTGANTSLNDLAFYTTSDNAVNTTEKVRITSAGNVGIGTTVPAAGAKLTAAGAILTTGNFSSTTGSSGGIDYSGGGLRLFSMGTSGATKGTFTFIAKGADDSSTTPVIIDSAGNVLVGATTLPSPAGPACKMFLVSNAANDGSHTATVQATGATTNRGVIVTYPNSSPNDDNNQPFYFIDSTSARFIVRSNGGVENYSANNVNLSDRREKTNFAPAKSYLDTICAIPVQTFNYIDQNHKDDPGLTLGVVAQDVQEVAPELVMESNWGTKDNPKQRLSIYQTDLQYALMKCIQEQQALITALTARVAALESN